MPENKPSILPPWPSYLFTLIALVALVTLVRVKSIADTAEQQVDVTPANPVFDSLTANTDAGTHNILTGNFIPVEAGNNSVRVTAQISDPNGCANISNVAITLFSTGYDYTQGDLQWKSYSGAVPSTDGVHFTDCTGAADTSAQVYLDYPLRSFVNPGDWTIRVEITDFDGLITVDTSNHFTVNSLAAFSTDGSIDYGTVALSAVSLEKTLTFTNTGNVSVDATVKASTQGALVGDMTEPSGNFDVIPASNVHYSKTSGFVHAAGAAVSKLTAQDFAINLPNQTVDDIIPGENAPTVPTYWKLLMPDSGVNGQYSNTLELTAVTWVP
ncbi:hypothetical protein HZC53_02840 [Candidatus Uhrbacteria bacterium]|nr:hypothetical protein [Candidatus Uhrbacteria bacterium]